MNRNRTIIFALVFIILGLVFYFSSSEKKPAKEQIKLLVPNTKDISKLEIKRNSSEFTFVKKNNGWQLEKPLSYSADNQRLEAIIKDLDNLELKDIISSNPSDFKKFDVDEASGINVKVFSDKGLVKEFVAGKMAADYLHNYVRDKNDIYIVSKVLSPLFSFSVDEIRDKKVLSFKTDTVTAFDITKDNKTISFVKTNNKWLSENIEYSNADSFITALSDLRLSQFKNSTDFKDELNPENIGLKVTVKYNNSSDTIEFNKKDENMKAGKSTYNNLVFFIDKQAVDSIKNFVFNKK